MNLRTADDFRGRNVHIIGMARSGLAAAEVLMHLGAVVTVHDGKRAADLLDGLENVERLGCASRVGDFAYEGIGSADAVVSSPGVPDTCAGLALAREHGIPVLPEIELAYRISAAPILAITGTNGKTTTTALLGEILRADGRTVYTAGNIVAGEIRLPLVKAAYQAVATDVIVAEISSFQLESISSFRPRVAGLLNITRDHLDRHPDVETYARMKGRLLEYQTCDDFAVINADDPGAVAAAPGVASTVWWFSRRGEVEIGTFARGSEVWLRTPAGDEFVCDTSTMKLRGLHNVENVLAAAGMARAFGASCESVGSAVQAFGPLEHRMEPVAVIRGVEFMNNSMCTNVAAAVNSLEAIDRPTVVIAGGKDKGSDYGPLGVAFVGRAKHVILIGRDAPLIESAARAAGYTALTYAASMAEAVDLAWRHAEEGDTVMLSPACASFGMFRDFEERGRAYKSLVRELAERVGD